MLSTNLSAASLLNLISLFENSQNTHIGEDGTRLRGVPGWEWYEFTQLTLDQIIEWTKHIGFVRHYPAPTVGENVMVRVCATNDSKGFSYRCPETLKHFYVSDKELAVRSVHVDKFLHLVTSLLGIECEDRMINVLIDDVFWSLGRMRQGNQWIDVYCVRNLFQNRSQIMTYLERQDMLDSGLLLSTGPAIPNHFRIPRAFKIVSMKALILENASVAEFDVEWIHKLCGMNSRAVSEAQCNQEKRSLYFDSVRSSLHIPNKPVWIVSGKQQRAVVEFLYEQSLQDNWWIPASLIIDAVYGVRRHSHSRRIRDIFKGKADWENYITRSARGVYGFNLS